MSNKSALTPYIRAELLRTLCGERKADVWISGGSVVDVVTGSIRKTDIAVTMGYIAGFGAFAAHKVVDARGMLICPGLINACTDLRTVYAAPRTLARMALSKGNAALMADCAPLACLAGAPGVSWLHFDTENMPLHFFTDLPLDGALAPLTCLPRTGCVYAPGAVWMDAAMPQRLEKLAGVILRATGGDARQLAACGVQIAGGFADAQEFERAIQAGLYAVLGEDQLKWLAPFRAYPGMLSRVLIANTAPSLAQLAAQGLTLPLVKAAARILGDPFSALRMAALTPAQAYGLGDLGSIAPGKRADLMLLRGKLADFDVCGMLFGGEAVCGFGISPDLAALAGDERLALRVPCAAAMPKTLDIPLSGKTQVLCAWENGWTFQTDTPAQAGGLFRADLSFAKALSINRLKEDDGCRLGIVSGLLLHGGAIAMTCGADPACITAVGDRDDWILSAVHTCLQEGGIAVVRAGQKPVVLPLPLVGVFSDAPVKKLLRQSEQLSKALSGLCKVGAQRALALLGMLSPAMAQKDGSV